tara:strand:- start:129 stop:917 length:789 start_codon:yes stop_codon:yes gene_type:complete
MNWKDIKNLIKEELTEGSQNHIVKYSKPNNTYQVWLGDKIVTDFATKEKANAKAKDLNDLQSVKDVDAAQKIAEATTVDAGGSKFNLRTGVNKNPTKLGIKIQFEPKGGMLDTDTKAKLEVALQEKLNVALAEYDMQISKDTDVPRPEVIGFFIPLAQIKNLIVKSLTGQKVDAPVAAAPEPEGETAPEGGEDSDIEEMIRKEMLNEMRVRDLNEISKVVSKDDFYEFINKGNNILRTLEENGRSVSEAKKYLKYLVAHNIM